MFHGNSPPWVLAAVLLVAPLAACQTGGGAPPAVSLEEAKEVTTSFRGESLVPPPRTISDVTAILDEQKLSAPAKTKKLQTQADAAPPDSEDPDTLTRFYQKRGESARLLGRTGQALTDLRLAARHMENGTVGSRFKSKLFKRLAFVESSAGNMRLAFNYFQDSIRLRPSTSAFRELIKYAAKGGNLQAAERAWKRGKEFISRRKAKGKGGPKANLDVEAARLDAEFFELQGRLREAEAAYRRAIETFARITGGEGKPSFLPSRKKQLAGNLRKQGRLVEAEIVAREALLEALEKIGRNNAVTADVSRQLASILFEQGRYDEAEKLVRAAIDIFEKSGTRRGTPIIGKAQRFLIGILVSREDWKEALGLLESVRSEMKDNPGRFKKMFLRNQDVALALLKSGRAGEALETMSNSYQRNRIKLGPKHAKTAGWGALLAMARAESGDSGQALRGFMDSLPVLLSRSRQSEDEETAKTAREQRLGLILESYIGLLADVRGTAIEGEAGIDAAAEAFRIADVARGRSVQKALAASGARATAGDLELADIARREQDAQMQIASLYALLADVLSLPTDQQDAEALQSLRADIDRLRGARAALMKEIETRFPQYADLINPKPGSVEQARAVLRPGEALISTYVGRERTYVWAVPDEGGVEFAATDLGIEDMADTIGLLRSSLEPNAESLGDIPDYDVEVAYDLYRQLLEPVAAGWKDADSLLVVAHGPLGYLPLSLLPTGPYAMPAEGELLFANHRGVPWLARTHAVTMLPSVASLKTLRSLPPPAAGRKPFVGFGDPYFSAKQAEQAAMPAREQDAAVALNSRGLKTRGLPVRLRAAPNTANLDSAELGQLPRLPDTSDEIASIALVLKADLTEDIFLGARASERLVKSADLSGYKVLAFATHGLVPGDLNGLAQPALALSAPEVAGGGGDGLLTMEEILGLRLDADWVVLSACNTASGNGAGAEAVSGLGRAFFYAGTRALLVSNWPVETTSAKMLTTDLFRRQSEDPGLTRAEALRLSMLSLIDGPGYVDPVSGKSMYAYAHPIFWAPFTLIGDGG